MLSARRMRLCIGRSRARLKRIILSNWTAAIVLAALVIYHARWFAITDPDTKAEAVSGFSAAIVALGIWLVVRSPFFRKGIWKAIQEAAGKELPPLRGFASSRGYLEKREAQRPQAVKDVIGDRIGLVLVFVGTILGGYSAPIARALMHAFENFSLDLWVRIAQIAATLIAAAVAVYVGTNWLKTLRNKSIDECLAALYDVVDLIDRCFAIPTDQTDNRWRAYDAAWDSWRKANAMWAVVHRYHTGLPPNYANGLANILIEARRALDRGGINGDQDVERVRTSAKSFRDSAAKLLAHPRRRTKR